MNKIYLIAILLVFLWTNITGCSDSSSVVNPEVESEKSVGYIIRDSFNNRVSTTGEVITPTFVHDGPKPNPARGGRIYDNFMIELATDTSIAPPAGVNPLINISTTTIDPNVLPETTWACSHCHGFDYEGGVYQFSNGATDNLLELNSVRNRDQNYVINMLNSGFSAFDATINSVINVHNYSAYLTPQAMLDVADFVVNKIYDTRVFIQAATKRGLGDPTEGLSMYISQPVIAGALPPMIRLDGVNFNCINCHGADGKMVVSHDIRQLAWENPFRWLHRVNFGSPRDSLVYPNLKAEIDGSVHPGLYQVAFTNGLHFADETQAADIMAYVQSDALLAPAVALQNP